MGGWKETVGCDKKVKRELFYAFLRNRASTHLRNKTIAHRVECVKPVFQFLLGHVSFLPVRACCGL